MFTIHNRKSSHAAPICIRMFPENPHLPTSNIPVTRPPLTSISSPYILVNLGIHQHHPETTVVLQSLHDRMLEVSPPLVPFIWCLLGGVNQTDGLGFHRWQSFRLVISLKLAQEFLVSMVAVVIGNSGWFVDWTLRVSLPLLPLLWYLLGGVNQTDGLGFCWQWSFWLVVSLKLVQKFLVGAKRAMGRLPWSLATSDGSFIGHLE